MGIVSDYLRTLVVRQLDEARLVVWFDPERHYTDFVADLSVPGAAIERYVGSFFALRRAVDPLLGGDAPPRLLVYVPLAEEETHEALVELTAIAAVIRPGQNALPRNTRLSTVARRALRDYVGAEKAEELARQVDAGRLALADLDRLGSADGGSAVIKSVFGTSDAQDVALAFLSSDRHDKAVAARQAADELAQLFARAFGFASSSAAPIAELRPALARHVLLAEFVASLAPPLPRELATIRLPDDAASVEACSALARTWRMRRDLQASYVAQADQLETALGLTGMRLPLETIRASETFAAIEAALQGAVEVALAGSPAPELLALASARAAGFWSEQRPTIQARWMLAHTAGQLLAEAARIERELRQAQRDAGALLDRYAEGDAPWCLLDTHQRHLERRWHTFELGAQATQQSLEDLVARARQRFMAVGDALASAFTRALGNAPQVPPRLARQRDIFASVVRPALASGKTAYILVDALRFEMARELLQSFDDEYGRRLSVALGTVPSITEIGMAALMPGAEGNASVVRAGEGKVGLKIGDTLLKDRRTRLDWLRRQVSDPLTITTLEEMLPRPKPALHAELEAAQLIVVTSQEIDELAERDNIRLARKVMDDVLADLARLVRKLREYGCKTIIIVADHGYLFGDELESDMKLDAPGGQTVDVHRRVWVGRGGAANDATLRMPLASFGLSDDLDIAVPLGFGIFRVAGGARAYFHGGMSPQELAVPVLVLQPTTVGRVTPLNAIEWQLTIGSKKITTRFCSVQIAAHSNSMFEFDPPRVRIEIRSKNESVAEPVSATYGLAAGTYEIELRASDDDPKRLEPNTVTLMLAGTPGKTASIHLLDAATGRELASIERVDVAMLAF